MKCLDLTDIQLKLPKNRFDHFVRVDHLYIGSKVDSLEQIEFLKSLNIKTVIDLKLSDETVFDDAGEFEKSGINYFNLPIDKIENLKFEQLQRFGKLISNDQDKILVYCISGNRVGAILALNACLVCGHPKKRALDFGEQVGMKSQKTKEIIYSLLKKGRLE